MIDPFDLALSDFIDSLPEEHDSARRLLEEAAPFGGQGDLPELAELATMLRAVPSPEPRAEWMAAAKARLMAAPVVPPEKRGLTWLGTMFLPLTHITFPSLPRLTMPSPVLARAVVAAALVITLGSMAASGSLVRSPLLQVTDQQGPIADAQQVIANLEQQLGSSDGSPRDIVLLSKQLQLADDAINQAPVSEQQQLRAQVQGAIRAVRFDGTLEQIVNATTVQIDGVAVQADPAIVQQLHAGQKVSLQVTVTSNGKLQALQVTPAAPPSTISVSRPAESNTDSTSTAGHGSSAGGSSQAGVTTATGGAQTVTHAPDKDAPTTVKSADAASDTKGTNATAGSDVKPKDSEGSSKSKSLGLLTGLVLLSDQDSSFKSDGKSEAALALVANASTVSSGSVSESSSNSSASGPLGWNSTPNKSGSSNNAGSSQSPPALHISTPAANGSITNSGNQASASSGSTGISRGTGNSGNSGSSGKGNPAKGSSSTGASKGDTGTSTSTNSASSNGPAKGDGARKRK